MAEQLADVVSIEDPEDDFTARVWTPQGSEVTFHFDQRKVIPAWELMDLLRVIADNQGKTMEEALTDMFAVIMASSIEEMKVLRRELFMTVKFSQNGNTPAPLIIEQNGRMIDRSNDAFADLSPDDVYVVMMRSLTVNFTRGSTTTGSSGESKD